MLNKKTSEGITRLQKIVSITKETMQLYNWKKQYSVIPLEGMLQKPYPPQEKAVQYKILIKETI